MSKYHITKRGAAAVCRAEKGRCPLGNENEHFATPREAYEAFQESMAKQVIAQPQTKTTAVAKRRQKYLKMLTDAMGEKKQAQDELKKLQKQMKQLKAKADFHEQELAETRDLYAKAQTAEEKQKWRAIARTVQDKLSPVQAQLKPLTAQEDRLSMKLLKATDKLRKADLVVKGEGLATPYSAHEEKSPIHFPVGTHSYERAVIAFAPKQNVEAGKSNTVHVVVPLGGQLTVRRRLEIARAAWTASGRSLETWDQAPQDKRLQWAETHMGRHFHVNVKANGGKVSWTTDAGSANNYSSDDVTLYQLDA